jgi:hypothetical protein
MSIPNSEMILPRHPDASVAQITDDLLRKGVKRTRASDGPGFRTVKHRRALGYWHSKYEPSLPNPKDFVDRNWDPGERELVAKYLEQGQHFLAWMGLSDCRFCDVVTGPSCLCDDEYVWPEGFAHYVRVHGVRPPQEFVNHVRHVLGGSK